MNSRGFSKCAYTRTNPLTREVLVRAYASDHCSSKLERERERERAHSDFQRALAEQLLEDRAVVDGVDTEAGPRGRRGERVLLHLRAERLHLHALQLPRRELHRLRAPVHRREQLPVVHVSALRRSRRTARRTANYVVL